MAAGPCASMELADAAHPWLKPGGEGPCGPLGRGHSRPGAARCSVWPTAVLGHSQGSGRGSSVMLQDAVRWHWGALSGSRYGAGDGSAGALDSPPHNIPIDPSEAFASPSAVVATAPAVPSRKPHSVPARASASRRRSR